jgi:aspartate aminotransferase
MQSQKANMRGQQQVQMQTQKPLGLATMTQELETSATLAMNEAVAKRRAAGLETIHLGFGEASFPLHPILRSELARAAAHTSYAPVSGIPTLREAIADYLQRTRGIAGSPAHVAVAPGSKPLLYALLQVLEGDLLLPVPSWVSYGPQAKLAGRRVIDVETDASDHHRLTPYVLGETLARARREGANPRILLVNTPSNPTGSMFDAADVEAIAHWAQEEGITLISDEIYAELAHGWREHVSPARFYPEGCIVTGGLSKAFSAGGWRLGYTVLPATNEGSALMGALRALASEIWSSATTPVQEAAIATFCPNMELEAYVRRSARIHGYVASRLYETFVGLGIPCPRPAGAFYLYPDFAPWRVALNKRGVTTSEELARYLLDEWGIATLPGTAFGEQPETLRLRLATSMLYEPEGKHTEEEREAWFWQLLEQADRLSPSGEDGKGRLRLPELERAQAKLTEVIQTLHASCSP